MARLDGLFKMTNGMFSAMLMCVCFLLCCHFTWAKPSVMDRVTPVKSPEGGLYSASDNVVILNVTNFESTVFGSNQAWFVEFYNRWCGHCIRFAPIWKDFASHVVGWKAAVQIGVIDCAVEANMPLCRTYNIEYFPTLRFFSAHHEGGNYGKPIENVKDLVNLWKTLIQLLETEQREGRGEHWPDLSPFMGADTQNLWESVAKSVQNPSSVRFAILIFQESNDEIGPDLVLDMSQVSQVYARHVPFENDALRQLMQVSNYPSVVVVSRENGNWELLETQDRSHDGLKSAIEAYLKLRGILIAHENQKADVTTNVSNSSGISDIQEQVQRIRVKMMNVAFLGDIEHALRFSLRHEIGSKKQMNGPVLRALNEYIYIISQHFPLSNNGRKLLQMLHDQVNGSTELTGKDWSALLERAENALDTPAWTEREDFLGCQGSQPKYRGYPCSLWTMFHVLTVNAMESGKGEPRDVLKAILGYVTHFFGCTECSKHFQSMAAATNFSDVINHNDSVLWLWEAHNTVNKRLAGDATEDPAFPKVQFPTVDHCPKCHEGETWVRQEVLQYLQSIYSHDSLRDLGSAGYESKQMNIVANGASGKAQAVSLSFILLSVLFTLDF